MFHPHFATLRIATVLRHKLQRSRSGRSSAVRTATRASRCNRAARYAAIRALRKSACLSLIQRHCVHYGFRRRQCVNVERNISAKLVAMHRVPLQYLKACQMQAATRSAIRPAGYAV